jgi:hypothetical protein
MADEQIDEIAEFEAQSIFVAYRDCDGDKLIVIEFPGSPDVWLPVGTEQELLEDFLDEEGLSFDKICRREAAEFVEVCPRHVRIMIDPCWLDGKIVYRELLNQCFH